METIEHYIERHTSPAPEILDALERDSWLRMLHGRMCSGHVQGRLLKMLTQMVNPRQALELGAFTGYSALCIAEGLSDGAMLHTVEIDDELEEHLLQTFARGGYADRIRLHIGDALQVMQSMESGSFQLVFMDADKRAYPAYYEECLRLLAPGGYILADNTLWDGHVVEERPRDKQTLGILEFNRIVADDPRTEQVILPLRDGLTIIRKL